MDEKYSILKMRNSDEDKISLKQNLTWINPFIMSMAFLIGVVGFMMFAFVFGPFVAIGFMSGYTAYLYQKSSKQIKAMTGGVEKTAFKASDAVSSPLQLGLGLDKPVVVNRQDVLRALMADDNVYKDAKVSKEQFLKAVRTLSDGQYKFAMKKTDESTYKKLSKAADRYNKVIDSLD